LPLGAPAGRGRARRLRRARDPGRLSEDRSRDRRLRVAGYGGARIAWGQLEDEPEAIAADLRALLSLPAMQHTNVRDNVRRS
jgi:hypothetical protein